MARFKFRLQGYRDLKGKLEDQAKLEYGVSLVKLERENAKKTSLETEREANILRFKEEARSTIRPSEFKMMGLYIERLKQEIAAQAVKVSKAEAEAQEKRLALVEAMKQRKMLDKLYEKARDSHYAEEAKAEQSIVDEVISYRLSKL